MSPTKRFRWLQKVSGEKILQQWFMADIGETYPSASQEREFRELRHPGGFWIDVPTVEEKK